MRKRPLRHQTRLDMRDLVVEGTAGVWKRFEATVRLFYWLDAMRNAGPGAGDGLGGLWLPPRVDEYSFSGTANDVDLGNGIVHHMQPTAARSVITGLVPQSYNRTNANGTRTGNVKLLLSDGDYGFELAHKSTGSAQANRIVCPYGKDLYVPPGPRDDLAHAVLLYYLGEPTPHPQNWAAYPLGRDPDVRHARLASDRTSSSTSLVDITGLGFPLEASTAYAFEYHLLWSSEEVAATGIKLSMNGPASPTTIGFLTKVQGPTASSFREETFSAYDSPSTAQSVATIGALNWATIWGIVRNGTNAGTLIPRYASETSGDDVKIWNGSWGRLTRTDPLTGV